MRDRKGPLVGMLLLVSTMLSGGCVEAFVEGMATGVSEGMAAVVENFITNSAANLRGDED